MINVLISLYPFQTVMIRTDFPSIMHTIIVTNPHTYKCPEAEVILIEHTDFILYDLPPVDDEGEDEW